MKDRKIIGVCGFIGSGKDTVGDYLVEKHDFKKVRFADRLKDTSAAMFGYDREMLEGSTKEARKAREEVDQFWSKKLGYEFSPRKSLQMIGTDLVTSHFYQNFWVDCVEAEILSSDKNIIVGDARFPNEIDMIRKLNGKIIKVERDHQNIPEYLKYYERNWDKLDDSNYHPDDKAKLLQLHPSEWKWIGYSNPDYTISNDGTLEELYATVEDILQGL